MWDTPVVDLTAEPDIHLTAVDSVAAFATHINIKRLLCASLTLVLYDFIITTDQIYELFAGRSWTISKIVFFINRWNGPYVILGIVIYTFIASPSERLCRAIPWFLMIGIAILIISLSMIFTIRVYALWNRSRKILFLCLGVATLNFGCYIVIVAYSTAAGFITTASTPFTGCTSISGSKKGFVMFVTSITFETMMITLTAIKSFPLARQREAHTPLFTMVLEDGLVYYFFILASHILNLIIIFTPSLAAASFVASYPVIAVMAVACNRLLLRQQRILIGPDSETTFLSFDLRTVSITLRSIQRHGSNLSFFLES